MSDYLEKLKSENPTIATRYKQKLSLINNIDPFCLKDSDISFNPMDFPSISNMDIIAYLVLTTSFYSKQQMKAYKSLNAFRYFEAGFVSGCGVMKVCDYIVVVGKVKHSQRMNAPPLRAWLICQQDGSIQTAHCTCMAGAGEVCSHIGAVMYAVEYIITSKTNTSCTDVAATWKVPSVTKVEYKKIKEMDFGRTVAYSKVVDDNITGLKESDISALLSDIEAAGSSAVLMRVVEPFATQIGKAMNSKKCISNVYSTLYKNEYEAWSLTNLIKLAESEYSSIEISQEQCNQIALETRKQADSQEWFAQRTGRITASKLKQVCSTKIEKPSLSLIKTICYPLKIKFKSKATEWGKLKEKVALTDYKNYQSLTHTNLEIEENVGLFIKNDFPHLGASPDGLVKCNCCGTGCIEIKCPYLLKDLNIKNFCEINTSCLITIDEDIQLNKNHSYYYQVQQQMALTNTMFCDFVVWSPTDLFIERILFNEDFWINKSNIAKRFHMEVIMPELLGRYYTKSSFTLGFCICNFGDGDRTVIKCQNDTCDIKWYHLECLNLAVEPTGSWICSYCKAK